MLRKYPVTKLASVLASVMLFVLLWGAIAVMGWDGSSSSETTDPAAVAVPEQAAPAPQPTPQTAPKDVEFTGEITAVSGSTFTVESHSELFTVTLAQGTTVHGGSIEVGARVKVHGYQGADGVVTASEVEVADDD